MPADQPRQRPPGLPGKTKEYHSEQRERIGGAIFNVSRPTTPSPAGASRQGVNYDECFPFQTDTHILFEVVV